MVNLQPGRTLLQQLFALPILWVLYDQALISAARLAAQVVVARYGISGEPGIGFYVSAFGFVVLSMTFTESFVSTPLNVYLPRQSPDRRSAFFAASLRAATTIIASYVSLCLMAFVILGLSDSQHSVMALTVAAYLPLHLLREYARRWLLANQETRVLVLWDTLATALLIFVLAGLIASHRINAYSIFAAMSLSNLLFVGGWWVRFHSWFDWRASGPSFLGEYGWPYGRWVAGEGAFGVLILYFSQWYVSATLDRTAADLYGSCLTLVFLANPFLLGITSYFGPRSAKIFHERGWESLRPMLWRHSAFVITTLSLLTVLIGVAGEAILTLLFGSDHASGAETATLLSLGMIFLGMSYLLALTLQAIGRPEVNFFSAALGAATVVGYSFVFMKPNIESAAWGFLLCAGVALLTRGAGLMLLVRRTLTG